MTSNSVPRTKPLLGPDGEFRISVTNFSGPESLRCSYESQADNFSFYIDIGPGFASHTEVINVSSIQPISYQRMLLYDEPKKRAVIEQNIRHHFERYDTGDRPLTGAAPKVTFGWYSW